ncbi:hypothetical protein GZH46_00394 [Fragariocoptes setiger]|uniref:Ig-like domain-containing protein n=1 Tax=Fragariocoptes setiger TaxID=1670756 RepID=A0ABQ7SCE1_9ACAR|nr:hypothetical protein GZH46_00394 [Fragariocoptes setiger]
MRLRINDFHYSDYGVYSCWAKNKLGESQTKLNVLPRDYTALPPPSASSSIGGSELHDEQVIQSGAKSSGGGTAKVVFTSKSTPGTNNNEQAKDGVAFVTASPQDLARWSSSSLPSSSTRATGNGPQRHHLSLSAIANQRTHATSQAHESLADNNHLDMKIDLDDDLDDDGTSSGSSGTSSALIPFDGRILTPLAAFFAYIISHWYILVEIYAWHVPR